MTEPIVHVPKNLDKPVTVINKSNRAVTKLSVVVPMYNVALFLEEALDSLLRQGISDELQVILIDDGSKDETATIAQTYVDQYPNIFELYLFENGGLGAARNRGTNLAVGEYVTYVDPDDIVTDFSYRKMLNIITRTGSDLIGGAVRRFNSSGKQWTSYVHNKAYHDTYEKTTLAEHPEMVWDSTAWNKLYRKDFVVKFSLYFPEKMLYEDMPTVVPMYSLARTIDILDDVVYLWRARDAGAPSITQATGQITNFTDRVKGMKMILSSLKSYRASQVAQDEQLHKMLDFDLTLPFTYDNFLTLDQSYKDAIYENVKSFLDILTPQQFNQARFWYRALYTVWLQQPKDIVQRAIETYAKKEFHITFDQKTKKLHSTYQDEFHFELPTFLSDFESRTRLYSVVREGDKLVLEGHLYHGYLDVHTESDFEDATVSFVNKDDQNIAPFTGSITFTEDPDITAYSGFDNTQTKVEEPAHEYRYSRYRIEIPFTDLQRLKESVYVKVTQFIHGLELNTIITEPVPGDAPRPEGYIFDGDFILPNYSSDWRFKLDRFADAPVVVNSVYHKNNYVWTINNTKKQVALWDSGSQEKIILREADGQYTLSENSKKRLGQDTGDAKRWWQMVTSDDLLDESTYEFVRMVQPVIAEPHSLGANMSIFHVSNHVATLAISWEYPIIKSLTVANEKATIKFWLGGWTRTAIGAKLTFGTDELANSYTAKKSTHGFGERQLWEVQMPLSFGQYDNQQWLHPEVTMHFLHRKSFTMPLRWGKSIHELLRETIAVNELEWRFAADDGEEHRQLVVRQKTNREYFKHVSDKVNFWHNEYQEYLNQPILNKTVVYASFWGKNFGDSPQAIYDYLSENYPDFEHIIVFRDVLQNIDIKNGHAIAFDTKEYWYYLARAKYFVNNVNFEEVERIKRPEQIEVQTMHGTPLKKMGFDVTADWKSSGYQRYLKKNRNWDYLTVPSDYVAKIAAQAYLHEATVLNVGYPRNDMLVQAAGTNRSAELKQKMGISANKRVVLYAPTWRKRGEVKLELDYQHLAANLPEDTLVVIKPHHLNTVIEFEPITGKVVLADENFTIDDYYLVADVMITDYSSTMFDYALLKKPMIFYVYDYETYALSRGLNFDFEADAPGPLVYNQEEMETALKQYNRISNRYASQIKVFNEKFMQYDDGHASQRAVEAVFTEDLE
ncbi:bifunctional glycosyltransferase family 2 protein/CDP-glycerol:glycerophosphate glycerophosphotransferase [Leuconostoc sp. C2]|uniref:bifunctional glycosyltransferase/CDP-glycerol:glycerophosphate glycerophosphotransferase n=1 Tax=Leuconostoc sp. (strain C2) TaxID=979982 RepID=UPI0002174577|nr:bifunctional glycosyltransferase family 2 protein/CDP-glycerol:glycerophosphate glycerophosphotransferase [Leuconostoc sp. C2]AEJ30916.1 teichoic acid biosynthesis protein [Leuconostoc sp. C2]